MQRDSEKGQRERKGLRQKKMRFKSEGEETKGGKEQQEKSSEDSGWGRHHGKRGRERRVPVQLCRANWDELPTGNLTLVMRR